MGAFGLCESVVFAAFPSAAFVSLSGAPARWLEASTSHAPLHRIIQTAHVCVVVEWCIVTPGRLLLGVDPRGHLTRVLCVCALERMGGDTPRRRKNDVAHRRSVRIDPALRLCARGGE